jgi:glycerate dehydrogenase
MKLTVLDGHALNPGDLSWNGFSPYADLTIFDRTPPELVKNHISNSEAVLLNKVVISSELLRNCHSLKYIGILATGYNIVDVKAAHEYGVCVTNVPAYSTAAVAQHVFAFITSFTNQVSLLNAGIHNGRWVSSPDFCYWDTPLMELEGKTLGILGYGHIGKRVAEIATAFGMNVICCTHHATPDVSGLVSKEDLFARSDFLTLHVPLTQETKEIINKDTLALMKRNAYLINTARGGLISENDVRVALDTGTIAGYACDVLTEEPMKKNCPLLGAPHCLITPHIAWAPKETRIRLMEIALKNFISYLSGSPQNVVS